jgi:hypothetical protein
MIVFYVLTRCRAVVDICIYLIRDQDGTIECFYGLHINRVDVYNVYDSPYGITTNGLLPFFVDCIIIQISIENSGLFLCYACRESIGGLLW